eukprot:352498-Chlamydomonas_euryale.AAC.12
MARKEHRLADLPKFRNRYGTVRLQSWEPRILWLCCSVARFPLGGQQAAGPLLGSLERSIDGWM